MKKQSIENLLRSVGNDVRMSPTEKERMRAYVNEYMSFTPKLVPEEPRTRLQNIFSYLRRPAYASVAIALIIFSTTGGVAYAAERTIPGDVLYGVKIHITEPARTVLSTSHKKKAEWHIRLAERRLEEAVILVDREKLNAEVASKLAKDFSKHSTNARRSLSLRVDADALVQDVRFAAHLSAYDTVITRLAERTGATTTTELHAALKTHMKRESRSPLQHKMVGQLGAEIEHAFQISNEALETRAKTIDTSTLIRVRKELMDAQDTADKGKIYMEREDGDSAERAFTDALSANARLDVLTRAASTLDVDIFGDATTTSRDETSAGLQLDI